MNFSYTTVLLDLLQDLDTEVVVATARGPDASAAAISANVVVDERQMNALFLDVVSLFSPLIPFAILSF